MYVFRKISKTETSFIKGVAMLFIVFHNFSHAIPPWKGENEFGFSFQNTSSFLQLLSDKPSDFVRLFFAFFGHYGVELFFFISGYGLFLSYVNKKIRWVDFVKNHLIKLYPTYLLAICFYFLLYPLRFQQFPDLTHLKIAALDLFFLQNFFPGHYPFKLIGPWWFFSVIFQFYILFPLIMKLFHRFGIKIVILLGLLSFALVFLLSTWIFENWDYTFFQFFIGWLPVFCLGILFAWLSEFKLPLWLIIISFCLVILGNLNIYFWYFVPVAVTIFLLSAIRKLMPLTAKNERIFSIVTWTGKNSLFIFAFHPMLRHPFVMGALKYNSPVLTILLGLAFIFVSLLAAWMVKKVENKIQKRFIQPYLAKRN